MVLSIDHTTIDSDQLVNRPPGLITDHLGRIDKPATIVDPSGRILVWYLPNMLSSKIHASRLP
jgi:hypothetical protein